MQQPERYRWAADGDLLRSLQLENGSDGLDGLQRRAGPINLKEL